METPIVLPPLLIFLRGSSCRCVRDVEGTTQPKLYCWVYSVVCHTDIDLSLHCTATIYFFLSVPTPDMFLVWYDFISFLDMRHEWLVIFGEDLRVS